MNKKKHSYESEQNKAVLFLPRLVEDSFKSMQ